MKKTAALLLAGVMALSLTACGGGSQGTDSAAASGQGAGGAQTETGGSSSSAGAEGKTKITFINGFTLSSSCRIRITTPSLRQTALIC